MLTSTQARDAKPRAKQYEISCDALPGFLLRVLPSGKKVFFVRYRDGERDVRERLGPLGPEFGVDAARKAALVVLSGREAAEEPRAIEAPWRAARRAQAESRERAASNPLAERSPEPHTGPCDRMRHRLPRPTTSTGRAATGALRARTRWCIANSRPSSTTPAARVTVRHRSLRRSRAPCPIACRPSPSSPSASPPTTSTPTSSRAPPATIASPCAATSCPRSAASRSTPSPRRTCSACTTACAASPAWRTMCAVCSA
jgi:hypothetical protein